MFVSDIEVTTFLQFGHAKNFNFFTFPPRTSRFSSSPFNKDSKSIWKKFAISGNKEISGQPKPRSHFETDLSLTFNFFLQ